MPRLRTTPASVRTTLTRLALAATAAALTVGGLTPAPAGAEGTTPSAPAGPARVAKQLFTNPVTPGTYTGLGFDQCHAPEQYKMDALAGGLAVPRRRHLHLGRLPRLPRPAQPHADLDQHPADERLAPAADHPRPAGQLPPWVPALRQRPGDQRQGQPAGPVRQGVPPGDHRGVDRGRRRAGARDRAGQHAVVRPRGVRRHQHRRAGSPRSGSSAPGPSSCTRWATSPASTPAPARASSRSTTRGCCGRGCSRCPTRSGSRGGTARPTPSTTYIRVGRLDAGRPDEAVPGRAQREVGRGDDQHRPQLPRPPLRDRGPGAAEPLPRHPGRPGQLPAAQVSVPEPHAEPGAGHRAQVPPEGAGRLPRPAQGCLDQAADQVGEALAAAGRAAPDRDVLAVGLDDPAQRGPGNGPQPRLVRRGRAPRPARAERRLGQVQAADQRHPRPRHPGGGESPGRPRTASRRTAWSARPPGPPSRRGTARRRLAAVGDRSAGGKRSTTGQADGGPPPGVRAERPTRTSRRPAR